MSPENFDISHIMFQLFDHAAESIVVVNSEGRVLYVNQITVAYGGKTVEEMRGNLLWELFPDSAGHYQQEFYRSAREQAAASFEFYLPPTDKWFEIRFYPSPDAVAIFSADITERKKHTEMIRLSEEKHRRFLEKVDQGYALCEMLYDAEGEPADYRYLEINPAFERVTGLANAAGKTAKEMLPELKTEWVEFFARVVSSREAAHFQSGVDSLESVFDVFAAPARDTQFLILFTNITERVRHEKNSEDLNIRLSRAMQETHHRVKNNLQIISALIDVQAGDVQDEALTEPLRRVQQHIRTLAMIHDLLTRNAKDDPDLAHLGASAVINTLIPLMQDSIGSRRIVAQIDEVTLTTEKAASLALLINEGISNAVKHGRGDIEITLRNEGAAARMEICDDGDGFPDGFDPRRAANTGLQLIESAGRWDLGGEVRYDNGADGGGRVTVLFPLKA